MKHQPDDLNQQPHLSLLNQEKKHSCDVSIPYHLFPLEIMAHSYENSGPIHRIPLKHLGSVSQIIGALPAKKDLWDFLRGLGSGQVGPQP